MQRRLATLIVLLSLACGGSNASRPVETTAVEAPAAHVTAPPTDGWQHFALDGGWPAAPEAPHQAEPIVGAPDGIADLREYTRALGVPDGRGCTLHQVEIVRWSRTDGDEHVRVPRMVLPAAPNATARFAIDDGRVVPISALGPELDLVTTCAAQLDAEDVSQVHTPMQDAWVPAPDLCPLEDAWPALLPDHADLVARYAALPLTVGYETYAGRHRADSLSHGGVEAFQRGDDAEALRDLDAFASLDGLELVPARTRDMMAFGHRSHELLDRDLLADIRALIGTPLPTDPDAAAVAGLRDVSMSGYLGPEHLAHVPAFARVVAMGERIVPALIDALDDDEALSRTTIVTLRWHHVVLLPRYEIVYAALASILGVDFVRDAMGDVLFFQSRETYDDVRARIRAYWNAFHATPAADRRWATLGDDTLPVRAWADAAVWLASDGPRTLVFTESVSPPAPREHGPLLGEPLRTRSEDGVTVTSRLLARLDRAAASTDFMAPPGSCALAIATMRWDRATVPHVESLYDALTHYDVLCPPAFFLEANDPAFFARFLRDHRDDFFLGFSDVWAPVRAQMRGQAEAAAAMEALYGPDTDPLDHVMEAGVLAREHVASARAFLARGLADTSVGGQLAPIDGSSTGDGWLTVGDTRLRVMSAHVQAARSVATCDVVAYYLRSHELPFDLGADDATREAQRAAIFAVIDAP